MGKKRVSKKIIILSVIACVLLLSTLAFGLKKDVHQYEVTSRIVFENTSKASIQPDHLQNYTSEAS